MPDLPHDLPEPGPDAPLPGPAPEPAIRTRGLSLLDVPPGALEPEGPLAQVAAQLVAAPADLAGGSLHAVGASGSISVAPHVSRPVAGLYVAAPTEAALEGWIASIDDALRRSREAAAHGPLHGRTALPLLAGLTLVVAACSILYELLLAQTLSALLGNTVLRYSITIGVFLGALGAGAILCGRQPARAAERLVRVELLLSIIGAASVPALYLFDGMQRIYWVHDTSDSNIGPAAFFVASHALIAAIGVLSGFEIPLLLQLGERIRRGSTNVVLGVDYLGSLVGSVLFPIVLLRELGLMKTAFVVAWLNALACIIAIAWLRPRRWRLAGFGAAVVLALLPFAIMRAEAIETHFVRKYYDFGQVDDIGDLLSTREGEADVQRHWSPYQFIDVVRDGDDTQWFTDLLSRRRKNAPSAPRDLWLYLNGDFQMFSGAEEFYHEWFVHAPVQGAGRAPRSALVLGGGDGLVVRVWSTTRSFGGSCTWSSTPRCSSCCMVIRPCGRSQRIPTTTHGSSWSTATRSRGCAATTSASTRSSSTCRIPWTTGMPPSTAASSTCWCVGICAPVASWRWTLPMETVRPRAACGRSTRARCARPASPRCVGS